MSLAIVMSVIALLIAFVALWLVSDVLKKVEGQNEKFLRAHISSIREEIREVEKTIGKATKSVKALTDGMQTVDKRISDHTNDIEGVRTRIAKMAEDLDILDRSIPQRYRARIVQPKEAEAPVVKAKPTVQ